MRWPFCYVFHRWHLTVDFALISVFFLSFLFLFLLVWVFTGFSCFWAGLLIIRFWLNFKACLWTRPAGNRRFLALVSVRELKTAWRARTFICLFVFILFKIIVFVFWRDVCSSSIIIITRCNKICSFLFWWNPIEKAAIRKSFAINCCCRCDVFLKRVLIFRYSSHSTMTKKCAMLFQKIWLFWSFFWGEGRMIKGLRMASFYRFLLPLKIMALSGTFGAHTSFSSRMIL